MEFTYSVKVTGYFQVCAHEATEGGMEYHSHGKECHTLADAIEVWRDAIRSEPQLDWIVAFHPEVKVK